MKEAGTFWLFVIVAIMLALAAIMVHPVSSCAPGNIQIIKVDEDNNLLGGATFKVMPNPYGGTYLLVADGGARDNDNTPGVITLTKVPVASYKVTENIAPAGYKLDNTTQTAKVTSNATTKLKFTDRRGTVPVSFSPTYENGPNGAVLTYIVTVTNTDNFPNTYSLTIIDNSGWPENISPTSLTVPPLSSGTAILSVTIPENAIGGTIDNVTVTATGTGVSGSGSCTAEVTINRPDNVPVSISPSSQSGSNGAVLTYTVTISNNGNVADTYNLSTTDNSGWPENISPTSITIPPFSSGTATLSVTVPSNATGGTIDNVTVTATGTGVSGSGSCTAGVTINLGVSVSISPGYQEALNGAIVNYTVTVVNSGITTDTYDLKITDNSGWDNIWLEDNALLVYGFDNENTTTLHVKIPDNASPFTDDNITVTAISRTDNTVKANSSCISHNAAIMAVNVVISPMDNGTVKNVTITNMGNVVDNYNLTIDENVDWKLMLDENFFGDVMPGENRVTTLHINIPSNTLSGTVGYITVTANSQIYPGVSGSGSLQVTAIRAVDVSISPNKNWGTAGETISYIATIRNIGNIVDNYCITKTDTMDWLMGGSFLWLYDVAAGSFAPVNFDVTVPENVNLHMKDDLKVTATSLVENTVFDNDNCIAFGPNLAAGWNLISFWEVSENDTPNSFFANHPIIYVIYYYVAPYGPYIETTNSQQVKLGVGYWVYFTKPAYIMGTGEPVENYSIDLVAGWNMVGFPVTSENTTPNNIFAGTTYTMYWWEAPDGPYHEQPHNQPVELGVGYWVYVDQDVTVTVPL